MLAPARACFDELVDYDRLPAWQSRLRSCEILARDGEGRGRDVRYEVDLTVRVVRYTLRHDYDEPTRIGSRYLDGDFRSFEGEYRLREEGETCVVGLDLRVDPGSWVPGPVKRRLEEVVLRRTLSDLKRRVEGSS